MTSMFGISKVRLFLPLIIHFPAKVLKDDELCNEFEMRRGTEVTTFVVFVYTIICVETLTTHLLNEMSTTTTS